MHGRVLSKFLKSNNPLKHWMMAAVYSETASRLSPVAAYSSLSDRSDPVKIKLSKEKIEPLFSPELKSLAHIFEKNGFELRIAGGAVRDLLMDIEPHDLDFATTATPDQMKEMFERESIRMINAKGEKHGTITPRINDKENFEVTTLRIDVRTDGRHADVQFTTDWKLDANRRDLTINSLFMDLEGIIYDYFNGIEDIKARRVLFVGDADTRIKEDYLRILRYFRFYGRIAVEPYCHSNDILNAIKSNTSGLANISGERIWSELKKILEGKYAGELVVTMLQLEMAKYLGLGEEVATEDFKLVWQRLKGLQYHGITLLAGLLSSSKEQAELQVSQLHGRLKFSSFERDLLLFLFTNRDNWLGEKTPSSNVEDISIKDYKKAVITSKFKPVDTKKWAVELLKFQGFPEQAAQLDAWEITRFPVNGHMVQANGCPGGRKIGIVLQRLKERWCDENYTLSAEDLLSLVPTTLEEIEKPKSPKQQNSSQ